MRRPKLYSLIFLIGVALAAPRAFPISRVGNSVIADPELEFQAEIPPDFIDVRTLSGGAVRLTSPFAGGVFFGSRATSTPTLDIFPLASEYPGLPDFGRSQTRAYFTGLGAAWTEITSPEPCVLALSAVNSGTTTTVLAWGARKGVVIVGAPETQVTAALAHLVGSLKLDRGQCQWK